MKSFKNKPRIKVSMGGGIQTSDFVRCAGFCKLQK